MSDETKCPDCGGRLTPPTEAEAMQDAYWCDRCARYVFVPLAPSEAGGAIRQAAQPTADISRVAAAAEWFEDLAAALVKDGYFTSEARVRERFVQPLRDAARLARPASESPSEAGGREEEYSTVACDMVPIRGDHEFARMLREASAALTRLGTSNRDAFLAHYLESQAARLASRPSGEDGAACPHCRGSGKTTTEPCPRCGSRAWTWRNVNPGVRFKTALPFCSECCRLTDEQRAARAAEGSA